MPTKICVTGGAGFIGSHTCVELLNAGFEVVIYDNFSNTTFEVPKRIEQITQKKLLCIQGDIRDEVQLTQALEGCDVVIHFAGLKAVGESVEKPLEYYDNNVNGTLCLLRAMKKQAIKKLVFSSSATVYGSPQYLPLREEHPLSTTNPYGHTKLVIEEMLRSLHVSDPSWAIVILRYFNPVGAHESGLIGEDPQGIPNNLMPYTAQVAIGRQKSVNIFGSDYDTPDGTGVRDYIHVVDLALGHIKALEVLSKPQCTAVNLGTGQGYSVLEVIKAFSKVSGKEIPYKVVPRRIGDISICYADVKFSQELLGWSATKDLETMCEDMWKFQIKNPKGYKIMSYFE